MSDYTEIESQMNKTKTKNIQSRTDLKKAEAAETQADAAKTAADAELIKAKGKKRRATIKNSAISIGLSALIAGGAWLGYRSKKGVKDIVDGTSETVEAVGKMTKTVGRVSNAVSDFVEDHTKDPDFAKFLVDSENQVGGSWLPGVRGSNAFSWSKTNPDFPITKKQLEVLLEQNKAFRKNNGRYMNNQEALEARKKLIEAEKRHHQRLETGSKAGTIQNQNSGR